MRKAAPKSRWQGRAIVVALALAVGVLAVFAHSNAKADAPPFHVTYSVTPANNVAGNAAELHHVFDIGDDPWPAAMFDNQITFNPQGWGIAYGASVPIGAVVGKLISDSTLGWFNNPCNALYGGSLGIHFDPILNCSTDTSDTIAFDDPDFFGDSDGNGIQEGCDKYPDFLNTMFPGLTPIARYAALEFIGINVSVNFAMFTPGTSLPLPGMPTITPDLGYVSVSVVNDPTGPLVPNQITDLCAPMGTDTYDYAVTLDNPLTAADESGYPWRTNPQYGGTYTFTCYASSLRDADNDDIDNDMDTCPHVVNAGDPRVMYSGDGDNDGIPNECDDTPEAADTDPDGDTFPNRQDNCPYVGNASQDDGDYDGIGDACDQDDWNDDGDITDPGEPTGFDINTPDGDYAEVWITEDVVITGPAVGGLAELPDVSDSSSRNYIALGGLAAAALVALSVSAWYARRRWLR